MARWQGSTTSRGYGSQHQSMRNRLLAAWKPGQPCARCGQPMLCRWLITPSGKRVSAIDLGHTDDRRGYTGLEHRSCNRRDGQAKTTAVNRARGRQLTPAQVQAIRWKQWQASARQGARR
jgi:hypothetical protein